MFIESNKSLLEKTPEDLRSQDKLTTENDLMGLLKIANLKYYFVNDLKEGRIRDSIEEVDDRNNKGRVKKKGLIYGPHSDKEIHISRLEIFNICNCIKRAFVFQREGINVFFPGLFKEENVLKQEEDELLIYIL